MNEFYIGNLRIKYPIVQGGMGVGISLSGLASAVANAGGIGVISAAGIGLTQQGISGNYREANIIGLQNVIRDAKMKSNGGVIGVNIMMALTDHEDLIITAIKENVDLIIIGAGLPLKIPAVIKNAGLTKIHTKLAVKVSSAKAANLICQYWSSKYNCVPDAVVVEGPMAGGHLGFKKDQLTGNFIPLSDLVKETVTQLKPFELQYNIKIPVIAAGGIFTGTDIYNILEAGASAVKMGTRFVATYECDASEKFKESYINCKEEDIEIIDSPVGLPGRVVKNEFVKQIKEGNRKPFKCAWNCLSSCNFREAPYCIALSLFNAGRGNMSEGFAFAGYNAYKIDKIQHVSDIFQELISEYNEIEKLKCLQTEKVSAF